MTRISWLQAEKEAYARTGQPKKAVGAYENALLRDPALSKAWHNMGIIYLQQALKAFVEMELSDENDPIARRGELMREEIFRLLEESGDSERRKKMDDPAQNQVEAYQQGRARIFEEFESKYDYIRIERLNPGDRALTISPPMRLSSTTICNTEQVPAATDPKPRCRMPIFSISA